MLTLSLLLEGIHKEGPDSQRRLEALSLYKEFSALEFARIEGELIAAMGLFYKMKSISSLYEFFMSRLGNVNRTQDGAVLTPVQASMRHAIEENKFVSISAPTSAGKSYSIKDFISSGAGDAVIVVPSRALIAEFMASLKEYFRDDRSIMIMPFVDAVFTSRSLRRIFVLTPERAREVFERRDALDIGVFFFDEAQVSEEGRRAVVFDVLVRRVAKEFPRAKMIFAHPFVANPEAQFVKHGFPKASSFAKSYPYGAVGKVFVYRHANSKDYYFSPFDEDGHHLRNCVEFGGGFANFALRSELSILSYVTKASIYSGKFSSDFDEYISELPAIGSPEALKIIEEVKLMLGADETGHRSKLISLMKKGVVVHHGSVPLEVRFLIENFIRGGHARLCFATSTLAQGVNMPFDVVWLNSMRMQGGDEAARSLSFKNLIGRAGRLSGQQKFDYGYVYTKNPVLLMEHMAGEFILSETSVLDEDSSEVNGDVREILDSIQNDSFDDEMHMPTSRLDRLRAGPAMDSIRSALLLLYPSETSTVDSLRGQENTRNRALFEQYLRVVYESYLGRDLLDGERVVFRTAISILLQTFGGSSFREIAGLRFSRITGRDEPGEYVKFSQQASELPDINLRTPYPLFEKGTKRQDVSYDVVVFDTYDYLDKVISFCLSDVLSASAKLYYGSTKDLRALKFVELLRFGTNDAVQVLMMRYGFLPEQLEAVTPYISRISEEEIVFTRDVVGAPAHVRELVSWYQSV